MSLHTSQSVQIFRILFTAYLDPVNIEIENCL
jgi:hypothetical protein